MNPTVALLLTALLAGCAALPAHREPLQERADRAYREGRWEEAARLYRALITGTPGAGPWFRLGNAYVELDRLEAAEDAYRWALALGDHPAARHNLGLLRLRLGLRDLRRARAGLPPDHPALAETRRLLRELLEMEP